MTIVEMNKFKYGGLAGLLLSQKADVNTIKNSLEALKNTDGFELGDAGASWIVAMASEKGVADSAKLYANDYNNAKSDISISEFKEYHSDSLKKLLGDDTFEYKSAIEEFDKIKGENEGNLTYGELAEYTMSAKDIMENKESSFEDMKEAEKILMKYGKVMNTLTFLEQNEFNYLIPAIKEQTVKQKLTEMFSRNGTTNVAA